MSAAADRLQRIQAEIASAAKLARRDPGEVTLIAVSKTRTAEEIEALIAAGQRDFGESRVQEALAKWPPILAAHPEHHPPLRRPAAIQQGRRGGAPVRRDPLARPDSLLEALVREADKQGRAPGVYVQVNIGDEAQKGGCAIAEVGELVAAVRASPLRLAGLMAIPPQDVEPAPFFALLAEIARRHGVTGLSMGMSADYQAAVKLGATAVRVGTALFERI